MRPGFVLFVTVALAAPGCVPARAPATAPPREPQPANARPDVTTAAGLAPLYSSTLASGEREVRVWIGGLGYPHRLYRITDREGAVTGEVIDYWPVDSDSTRPAATRFERVVRYYEAGACGRVRRRGSIETCRVRFARKPDWAQVLRTAEAAGV